MNESLVNVNIGWNEITVSRNHIVLYIVLVGILLHSIFWFQLLIYKVKLNLSFIFTLGYLLTDVVLMIAFLIQYGIRTNTLTSISRISCYFEAYFTIYVAIFESLYLTCFSIVRYYEIVLNINIYHVYSNRIILISIILPALLVINMIIQHNFGWCIVIEEVGSSCSLAYSNIPVRFWNEILLFILPILISLCVIIRSLIYIKKNDHLQMNSHTIHHHRRSMYRYFIFYIIWLILCGPFIFVTLFSEESMNDNIEFIVVLLATLDTTLDAYLICDLDKRFRMVWKKTFRYMKTKFNLRTNSKIHCINL